MRLLTPLQCHPTLNDRDGGETRPCLDDPWLTLKELQAEVLSVE